MKLVRSILLLIAIVASTISCLGQINTFSDILAKPVVNKTLIKKDTAIESKRTFLGVIKDSKRRTVFYVAKEFYTVRAAIVRHGHSRIIFFDRQKKLIASYWIDSQLPYSLVDNTLYFKYENSNSTKKLVYKEHIGPILPDHICVKINDCYTAEIVKGKD